MLPFIFIVPFLIASLQPTLSAAFSWHLTTAPAQCSNLSISIAGSDGVPPYHVLIIPFGPSPLPNNVDVRPVIDQAFDGNSTSVSFPINYPANSHFVAVVSDTNGFGTGGASVETSVADSNDTSCFDPSKPWQTPFYYYVTDSQLTQCQPTRIWWFAANARGIPSFVGVIPGGQSFKLPETSITDIPNQGTGFTWTPNIQQGTTFIIVGGDDRGMGTAGRMQYTVHLGSDATCLNNLSPTSTLGVAAGSLETNVASNAANDGGPNVGLIVGAAVGGIIGLLALVAFIVLSYYCLREDGRRSQRLTKRDPTVSSTGRLSSPASRQLSAYTHRGTSIATDDPLAHYHPEPFAFAGVGTYNNGYTHGGEGYVGGMTPGTASAVPPHSRLNSMTSGTGAGMSDTSSHVGSRYGGSPPQGANPGLPQMTGLPSMKSGSGGGSGLYDTSSQMGSKCGAPSQGANPALAQMTGLPSVKSGSGGLYDTSSQMGSKCGAPSQGANPALPTGLPSMKSGSGGGGSLYDASSQMGSKSVISGTSGPPHTKGGPSSFQYEDTVPTEPPPAFTPSDMSKNPPTGDVKYQITNPG